jgi:CDGSH-type Zn-finger protein
MMGGSGKHRPTTVTVYPDGPLVVRGTVEIADADGTVIEHGGGAVALCRCGKSAVKPFCDGNHKLARLRLS